MADEQIDDRAAIQYVLAHMPADQLAVLASLNQALYGGTEEEAVQRELDALTEWIAEGLALFGPEEDE